MCAYIKDVDGPLTFDDLTGQWQIQDFGKGVSGLAVLVYMLL